MKTVKEITFVLIGWVLLIIAAKFVSGGTPPPFTEGFTLSGGTAQRCVTGFSCSNFRVYFVAFDRYPQEGILAAKLTTNPNPVGAIVLFSGNSGCGFWSPNGSLALQTIQRLNDFGYDVFEVGWQGNGWPNSWGQPLGFVKLSVRPATVVRWIHDNWQRGNRLVVSGESEGSFASELCVVANGLSDIVDQVVMTSGPPMGDINDGCMGTPAYDGSYVTYVGQGPLLDQPWGYPQYVCGPCCQHNTAWISTWRDNSGATVLNGIYNYPNTRVDFLIGGNDEPLVKNQAKQAYNAYLAAGQSPLSWTLVPGMPHSISNNQAGLNTFYNLLAW